MSSGFILSRASLEACLANSIIWGGHASASRRTRDHAAPVNLICRKSVFAHWYYAIFWSAEDLGRKRMGYTVTALKSGPVHIVALGCALTATFVLLYVLCFLAAVLFPNAALTHAWLGLYSTAPVGSVRGLVEGIIWNVVFAWIAAITFGATYNSLAPSLGRPTRRDTPEAPASRSRSDLSEEDLRVLHALVRHQVKKSRAKPTSETDPIAG